MIKFLVFILIGIFVVSSVSAYYCIEEEDNDAIKQFKSNVNLLALKQDIQDHGITKDELLLKLKYFTGCR